MTSDYSVLTPERVALEYGVAGVGSRGGAVMIDTGLQAVMLGVISAAVLGAALASSSFGISVPPGLYIAVVVVGLFTITSGYFMLFEIVWSGQTPGKRLFGLRVIRDSGYPLRPIDAVIRNLVRIADWLPLGYGIGVMVMLVNQRSKRLGDFAAGTLVVREGARRALTRTDIPEHTPAVVALSAADATLVRDFLTRRAGMAPTARNNLAVRLAIAIARRYGLTFDGDPESFLERLTP